MKAYKGITIVKVLKSEKSSTGLEYGSTQLDYFEVIDSEDKDLIGKNIYCNDFGNKAYNIDGEQYLFIKNEDILGVCQE